MNIIHVKNKNGVTYVYESHNYWDKVKKQSRSKRVCIGKLDDQGTLIPSKRLVDPPATSVTKRGPVPCVSTRHSYYGATYLFDAIGEELGITQDLKICFPEIYKQILSVAYYLILEDRNPLLRFPKWDRTHYHPYGSCIPSQNRVARRQGATLSSSLSQNRTCVFRIRLMQFLSRCVTVIQL